jgi:hypothetical protein
MEYFDPQSVFTKCEDEPILLEGIRTLDKIASY